MYRAPISTGRDAIGQAVGYGLAGGAQALASGMAERHRRDKEEEERKRRELLEEEARVARARAQAIEDARMGVISQNEAMTGDPIAHATGPNFRVPQEGLVQPDATPRTLREGVTRAGDLYIDPRRGLDYQVGRIAQQDRINDAVTAEEAEVERAADRLMQANPDLSREDAIARAAGLSTTSPMTHPERMGQLRDELEIREEFEDQAWNRRYGAGGTRGMTAGQTRDAVLEQGRGLAATAARFTRGLEEEIASGERTAGPGWDPVGNIRAQIRRSAQSNGVQLSEPDIQALAMQAYHGMQDQENQVRRMEQERNREVSRQQAVAAIRQGANTDRVVEAFARDNGISIDEAYELLGI